MENIKLKNILNEEVQITIVDNESEADFITHSGTFHADEVVSTVLLLNKFTSIKLYRANDVNSTDAFVYDIGFGEFDHHGIDFDEKRENGIKYASCGLIWKKYGKEIISKLNINNVDDFVQSVDKNIIMDIDRDDNGQSLGVELPIKIQNISSLISAFNPSWDDLSNENICFLNALLFANTIFNNIINKMLSKENARLIIEEKLEESKDGILILDRYMPWKDIVLTSSNPKSNDILYAVFPSKRGGYNIVATPKELGSFAVKKPFPKLWAGKEKEELQKISDINTITFCHKGLFICACKTLEDALKIAKIAIKNND